MQMAPTGGTDIFDALKVGLHLVELAQPQSKDADMPQPIIVFLTDGDPTVGVTSTEQIISKVSISWNFRFPVIDEFTLMPDKRVQLRSEKVACLRPVVRSRR